MTDDQLVEQNIALGVQADAIRDQRRALVAELRARHEAGESLDKLNSI